MSKENLARFFVALLPPQEIQDYTNQVKQHFADQYGCRAAQKSPPHITLQPPFEWLAAEIAPVQACLHTFAASRIAVPVTLLGFGAFPPRVIYINVLKTPELLTLQAELTAQFETELGIVEATARQRSFSPHMTVAFRDLSRQHFRAAWPQFESRSLQFEFQATHLTLLIHTGQRWNVHSEFPLQPFPAETKGP